MRLKDENPELNGIVKSYNLRGFSFREFLNLKAGLNIRSYTLEEILRDHEDIAKAIVKEVSPREYFMEYLHHGFYPFFLNKTNYSEQLLKTMNIVELNHFIDQQRAKGSDHIRQIEVEHHARYAYPLGTFILTLIGVSLSSRKVRGGTGLHIGIGIALCFSYIMLNRVFEEFAKGGSLPTMLAVWLPNVIFLCVGIYLYRKAPK